MKNNIVIVIISLVWFSLAKGELTELPLHKHVQGITPKGELPVCCEEYVLLLNYKFTRK